jgi:trimethylamine--corrinoid protein Co-methyltransferase
MAEHTMAHWPTELYLPSPIVDRDNRENWMRAGGKDTYQRAIDEVDRRLAAYRPVATDEAIDAELRRIIRSGFESQTELPFVPAAAEPSAEALAAAAAVAGGDGVGRARRVNPRRRAG